METDLRRAVAESQFELHYQPLIDAKTLKVLAFEALLRWRHPKDGLISPAVFIPIAEEMGLIGLHRQLGFKAGHARMLSRGRKNTGLP